MAVAIVAGLECFYSCSDSTVRNICIAALSRLVFENERIFLDEDQLAAVWNLYFALNTCSTIGSLVYPDRTVVIKALNLLTHLFTTDVGLTYRIIDSLLRLPDKVISCNRAN
jgi:hypothetical protein